MLPGYAVSPPLAKTLIQSYKLVVKGLFNKTIE